MKRFDDTPEVYDLAADVIIALPRILRLTRSRRNLPISVVSKQTGVAHKTLTRLEATKRLPATFGYGDGRSSINASSAVAILKWAARED